METVIRDGKIVRNGLGLPQTVDGDAAVLQRAANRVAAIRGRFPYDPAIGSRIAASLPIAEHAAETALGFARESLYQVPEAKADSAAPKENLVTVHIRTARGETDVTVRGEETEHDI